MKFGKTMIAVLVVLSLTLFCPVTFAGKSSDGGSISATDVESVTDVGGRHLILVNDGTDEVYVTLDMETGNGDTATTSEFELKSGESVVLDTVIRIQRVNIVCDSAETATVRYFYWE